LSEREAVAAGYEIETVLAPAPDKAHFMPEAKPLLLKLVADKNTRKLLGAQSVGSGEGDKRIDVAAMALTAGFTVDQISHADLCYAPPFSPAMDNILAAANVMRNKLDGRFIGITAEEVYNMNKEGKDFFFLDCRSPKEYEEMRITDATLIPLGEIRNRLSDIPKNKPVVCFCKISLRGYEAALILNNAGYKDVRVMDGGVLMWPYEREI
jgi:rhodanese-related sulfurtransferase